MRSKPQRLLLHPKRAEATASRSSKRPSLPLPQLCSLLVVGICVLRILLLIFRALRLLRGRQITLLRLFFVPELGDLSWLML